MSLHDLNPQTRRRLRRHATVLVLWCLVVGVAASWLLLRGAGIDHPVARYALAATVMYGVGLVVGTRLWLVHFAGNVQIERGMGHATPAERAAAEADEQDRRERTRLRGWDWLDALNVFHLGEVAFLLVVPAIVVAAVALVFAAAAGPVLVADGVAGLLAEVALQFVFGALIAKRVLKPRDHGGALSSIVGRTWLIGILMVLASIAFGVTLRWLAPGAVVLADLWR